MRLRGVCVCVGVYTWDSLAPIRFPRLGERNVELARALFFRDLSSNNLSLQSLRFLLIYVLCGV